MSLAPSRIRNVGESRERLAGTVITQSAAVPYAESSRGSLPRLRRSEPLPQLGTVWFLDRLGRKHLLVVLESALFEFGHRVPTWPVVLVRFITPAVDPVDLVPKPLALHPEDRKATHAADLGCQERLDMSAPTQLPHRIAEWIQPGITRPVPRARHDLSMQLNRPGRSTVCCPITDRRSSAGPSNQNRQRVADQVNAIRAEYADEEAEAAEAEAAERNAALDIPLNLRIDKDLDAQLKRRAAQAQIPVSALVRRLLREATTRPETQRLTVEQGEQIARRVLNEGS